MPRLLLAQLAVLGLIASGCAASAAPYLPHTATPRPIVHPLTPTVEVIDNAPVEAKADATPAPAQTRSPRGSTARYVVSGTIFDVNADASHGLSGAAVEWRYLSAEPPAADGERLADDTGAYRVVLDLNEADEVALTARAPGYAPSTVRLNSRLFGDFGAKLNFALHRLGAEPTVPGDLGMVEVRGLVYNAARGPQAPLAATIIVTHTSVVRPTTRLTITAGLSGTFAIPMVCHTADRLEFTVSSPGFVTVTVSRRASELVQQPQLRLALPPASP